MIIFAFPMKYYPDWYPQFPELYPPDENRLPSRVSRPKLGAEEEKKAVRSKRLAMPTIEEPALTLEEASALLMQWQALQAELTRVKNNELLLRQRLFRHFFPVAKEGTNHHNLGHGYKLDAVVPYTREVDAEALLGLSNELPAAGIDLDALIKYKPSLVTSAYRDLTDVQQKLFDRCLTIKPGSPTLKLVAPKDEGG